MAKKKQNVINAEVFIQDDFSNFERMHLLEHVHFLEERMNRVENKTDMLWSMFRELLAFNEDDEEDEEDECEDEYEEEDEEDELRNFFRAHCMCSWDDEDEEDD